MSPQTPIPSKNRLIVGGAIFGLGQLAPLLVPVVAMSGLSTAWKSALSGFLLLGIPELAVLGAIAVLGKSGFNYLKSLLFKLLKRQAPPDKVSRTRYRIGLTIFLIPILFTFISPYAGHMIPYYRENPIVFGISGDVLILISLVILGGDFWDKLRSLFVHRARAHFPAQASSSS